MDDDVCWYFPYFLLPHGKNFQEFHVSNQQYICMLDLSSMHEIHVSRLSHICVVPYRHAT